MIYVIMSVDVNFWTLVAIIISIVLTSVFSLIGIFQTRRHIKENSKINSANLSVNLFEIVRKQFKDETVKVLKNQVTEDDVRDLKRYLNHLENICRFHNDGILTTEHVHDMYRQPLLRIRDDKIFERFFADEIRENPRLYENIKSMFDKID